MTTDELIDRMRRKIRDIRSQELLRSMLVLADLVKNQLWFGQCAVDQPVAIWQIVLVFTKGTLPRSAKCPTEVRRAFQFTGIPDVKIFLIHFVV